MKSPGETINLLSSSYFSFEILYLVLKRSYIAFCCSYTTYSLFLTKKSFFKALPKGPLRIPSSLSTNSENLRSSQALI